MLRAIIRRILQPVLWLAYRYYNRRAHWVTMDGIRIFLAPGVFHPRWFLTTRTLRDYALTQVRPHHSVLELGAGNGFLALSCSQVGATVTASDINPAAIDSLQRSSTANKLPLQIIQSDLFEQIDEPAFDFIFINPPYFPKQATNDPERAFFCGEDFEYFHRLFAALPRYATATTLMILTDDCELGQIQRIAAQQGLELDLVQATHKWGEQHFIYRVQGKVLAD